MWNKSSPLETWFSILSLDLYFNHCQTLFDCTDVPVFEPLFSSAGVFTLVDERAPQGN